MLVEIAVGGSRPQLCPDCTPWVPPDMTECEHGGLKRKCRVCELEAENAELKKELDEECDTVNARKILIELLDDLRESDSFGVPGSDFEKCLACGGGSYPGKPFEHQLNCPAEKASAALANDVTVRTNLDLMTAQHEAAKRRVGELEKELAEAKSASEATIKDILYCALRYDDKPHRLWDKMRVLAESVGLADDATIFASWYNEGDPIKRERDSLLAEFDNYKHAVFDCVPSGRLGAISNRFLKLESDRKAKPNA